MQQEEVKSQDEEEMILQQMMKEEGDDVKEEPLPEESKIGKTLSEVTTKTVIIMVLIVMLSVPLFTFDTYAEESTSFQIGLDYITLFDSNINGSGFTTAYNSYYNRHRNLNTPLIFIAAGNYTFDDPNVDNTILRSNEQVVIYPTKDDLNSTYLAIFDMRNNTQLEAVLSIIQTIFICICLTVGAVVFNKDANDLVIGPIEQMMVKVQRIAKNPLEAAKEEENEAVALKKIEKEEREANKKACCKV